MTALTEVGVVFDLDGTLVDSRADIATAANFALAQHGRPMHSEQQIARFVGDGARSLIARAARLPHDSPAVLPLLATFLDYYAAHACCHTTLMPGAREALDALRGLRLALLTNKPRRSTDAVLAALRIDDRFSCIIAGGDLPFLKPDPELLFEIARRLELAASALVMVGDGPQDVLCGRNAGAFTVGVVGGIADPQSLHDSEPHRLLGSLHELPAVVEELLVAGTRNDRVYPAKR